MSEAFFQFERCGWTHPDGRQCVKPCMGDHSHAGRHLLAASPPTQDTYAAIMEAWGFEGPEVARVIALAARHKAVTGVPVSADRFIRQVIRLHATLLPTAEAFFHPDVGVV